MPGAAKKDSEKSEYVVAPRRTIYGAGGKPIGPGEPFPADASEVDHLVKTGFLVKAAGDDADSSYGVAVGGLKINGGRKPGGVIA